MNANRLASEKSPYLLQHQFNPVDWYPWNEEAFEKAKRENKPIFLSIGYSTCHWCHVMEKESFEDESVARLMNETFVSIKVDREERPDIDGIYMTVCQMLTGSGGWPLTIIMSPDKKPFFAGTYFPKEGRYGRMGMMELVPKIKKLWDEKKEDILNSTEKILNALRNEQQSYGGEELTEKVLEESYDLFEQRYDKQNGGFGNAPKFPSPHNLMFLLRYYFRTGCQYASDMVEKSLVEMRKGGIYDQVGFGFHRYSTDEKWLVPHFEKMLYDQALLVMAYTEMFLVNKKLCHKKTVEETLEYVTRDMTSPEGGFYSAEDADSEGEEGKFYLWTTEEMIKILGGDDADFATRVFNIEREGNWIDPMEGELSGTNIPHILKSVPELCNDFGITEHELIKKLDELRIKLFTAREARVHPQKDDKVLTDWNGLMISAFARASIAFSNKDYLATAVKAAAFILSKLLDGNGRLLHRWRQGESGLSAHIDDYAFFIAALLDLYDASFDLKFLTMADSFTVTAIQHFWDDANGGFFFTADDGEELLIRQKNVYDGAVPSGNSVMLLNLLRLARMTGNVPFEEKADQLIKAFSVVIEKAPIAYSQFLCGLEFAFGNSKEIVITSKSFDDEVKEFLEIINEKYLPNKVVLLKTERNKDELAIRSPFTKDLKIFETPAIYVCENFSCRVPVRGKAKLKKIL